jgi:dihydroorotase
LQLTCSVTPYHLYFIDNDLADYDTNLKVNPPLRSLEDKEALIEAVLDGTIDFIASHHRPQHADDKVVEFEYAKNGMTGFQTSFAAVHTAIPKLTSEKLVDLFSLNARKQFGLPVKAFKRMQMPAFPCFCLIINGLLTFHRICPYHPTQLFLADL